MGRVYNKKTKFYHSKKKMRSENNIGEMNGTSVKVHHAPGGQSNLSLGWDDNSNYNQPSKKQQAHLQSNFSLGDGKRDYERNENNLGEGNTTSVKVHHAPGGQSNFDLGHQGGDVQPHYSKNQQITNTGGQEESQGFKPSVRVHNPPGGRSNITFG